MQDCREFAIRAYSNEGWKVTQGQLLANWFQRPAIGEECLSIVLNTGKFDWRLREGFGCKSGNHCDREQFCSSRKVISRSHRMFLKVIQVRIERVIV